LLAEDRRSHVWGLQPDTLSSTNASRWNWSPSVRKTDLPFAFDMSMGVRQNDEALAAQLRK
jgi:hypothetical protein